MWARHSLGLFDSSVVLFWEKPDIKLNYGRKADDATVDAAEVQKHQDLMMAIRRSTNGVIPSKKCFKSALRAIADGVAVRWESTEMGLRCVACEH